MRVSMLRRLLVCPLILAAFVVAQESSAPASAASDVSVPAGPALDEGQVIVLLQARVPLEVIQKFVATRGVNFVSTKDTSKRVLAAGGNVALVGTINLNQKDELAAISSGKDKDKEKKR